MPMLILSFVTKNWKAFVIGAAVLVVVVYGIHLRNKFIAEGADRELKKIERANEAAEGQANVGQANVDQCI